MDALEKFAAIFRHSPWLMASDNAVHIPVSGMPKDHQVTWKEVAKLVATAQMRLNQQNAVKETEK